MNECDSFQLESWSAPARLGSARNLHSSGSLEPENSSSNSSLLLTYYCIHRSLCLLIITYVEVSVINKTDVSFFTFSSVYKYLRSLRISCLTRFFCYEWINKDNFFFASKFKIMHHRMIKEFSFPFLYLYSGSFLPRQLLIDNYQVKKYVKESQFLLFSRHKVYKNANSLET